MGETKIPMQELESKVCGGGLIGDRVCNRGILW